MRSPLTSLASLALLALAVAACGNGGGGTTVEATDDFEFSPAALTIEAETDTDITLDNVGVVEHDWTIEELDLEIYAAGGETTTETINVPAGTYDVICTIPGHAEAGMVGTLTAE